MRIPKTTSTINNKPLRKMKCPIVPSEPALPTEKMDFRKEVSWRIFRIMAEFIDGFQFLADLKKEVSFFGSARCGENSENYKDAHRLAKMLGQQGFTIITGGGPGIMEAANRGATEAGAESVGLNIQLPKAQRVNKYVNISMGFNYFFTRKTMLSASAQVYIFFPGGFGTLDEFFEIITLIQTKKMEDIPVILVEKKFWGPLLQWVDDQLCKKDQSIDKKDMNIYKLVDSVEEAYDLIIKSKEREYF